MPARTCRCSAIVPWSSPSPNKPNPRAQSGSASGRRRCHARAATGCAGPGRPRLAGQPRPRQSWCTPASPTRTWDDRGRDHFAATPARASRPISMSGIHESGWPLVIVGDRDGAPMVLVPGGTFSMGNNEGQPAEAPAHQVRLSTYYIDQHEVTNRQFRIFLGESHYHGQPAGQVADRRQSPGGARDRRRSFMSTSTTPRRLRPGPASNSRPRRNGRWRRGRPTAAGIPGATRPPNGHAPRALPPDRSGHDVPGRRVALRRLRHGGQRPGVDQGLCSTPSIITSSRRRSPTTRPGRLRAAAPAHRSTSFAGPPRTGR